VDGIYIREDGKIVSKDTTTSECKELGDWDPTNAAGKGIVIDDDSVSDATTAALAVGPDNSKSVVVRNQVFNATALAGLTQDSHGALLEADSIFCSSTFEAEGTQNGVETSGPLKIKSSTLIGGTGKSGLVTGGTTTIVGSDTLIVGGTGTLPAIRHASGGTLEIHGGTFGDGSEQWSVFRTSGNVRVYGGTFNSQLKNGAGAAGVRLKIFLKDNGRGKFLRRLCDGSPFNYITKISGFYELNFCPENYQAPTFPECE